MAALSKNYRYSTNVQIAIDIDTRLVIAAGDPQPGNRNDCTVYRSSGNPEVIMPYRKPRDGSDLPEWKEELNAVHRTVRARDIQQWAADLHAFGYQHTTVHGLLSLLGRVLGDAADDRLIPANPVHHHRNRGRRAHHIIREMLWATPEEVLHGAHQAARLHHRGSALLIVTAAWTDCR